VVYAWHADDYPHEEMFLRDLHDGILRPQLPFLTPGKLTLPAVTWVDPPQPDSPLEVHLAKDTPSMPPVTSNKPVAVALQYDRKQQLRAEVRAQAALRINA
jgi:hypothetical protein